MPIAEIRFDHKEQLWEAIIGEETFSVYDPLKLYATDLNRFDTFHANVQINEELKVAIIKG